MRIPDGWQRFKPFEGILPISKTNRIRYYTPATGGGRSIWITELNEHHYRLHLYTHREKYDRLEEAEKAAIKWMENNPQ